MRRLLAIALAMMPIAAAAQTTGTYVVVSKYTVSDAAGTQTDPHVSGNLVSYTNQAITPAEVRVHTLGGAAPNDIAIDNLGSADSSSDVSGQRIVFTRTTGTHRSIHLHDLGLSPPPTAELDRKPSAERDSAAIGSDTVAWVEGTQNRLETEIVAYDIVSGNATSLTEGRFSDREPAVVPSGNAIVFTRCDTNGPGCDILRADRDANGGWMVSAMTGTASWMKKDRGEESRPATDGTIVAYESVRLNDRDIWYQPMGGGAEMQVPLTEGIQQNASVAGGLIAFESRPLGLDAKSDIYLYDTATGRRYQLTYTPDEDERLSDLDVDPATGEVTVVYVHVVALHDAAGNVIGTDENIEALRFKRDVPPQDPCDPTGDREVLARLTLTRGVRDAAGPLEFNTTEGMGLLCVQNGYTVENDYTKTLAATTGKVTFNGEIRFGSADFQKKVVWLEASVHLQEGVNVLSAAIGGAPGTTYTVTVYGPLEVTAGSATAGCSSTAASASLLGLLAIVALVVRNGRRKPVRIRRVDRQ